MFKLPLFSSSGGDGKKRQAQPFSRMTQHKESRLEGATVTESVCPYCAVGCGLAHLHQRRPNSLTSRATRTARRSMSGTLCPKRRQQSTSSPVNPHRVNHVVKYRAPVSRPNGKQKPLDWAIEQIALAHERIHDDRERG